MPRLGRLAFTRNQHFSKLLVKKGVNEARTRHCATEFSSRDSHGPNALTGRTRRGLIGVTRDRYVESSLIWTADGDDGERDEALRDKLLP